jgi:hypothetical protein
VALTPLISAAQRALRIPLAAARERALSQLASVEQRDASWLEAIASLTTARPLPDIAENAVRVHAVIVLRRRAGSPDGLP